MDERAYQIAVEQHLERGMVNATYYRRGAIVTGWPSRWPSTSGQRIHKRGIIRNATVRSLIRGGFAISNAPVDFDCLTTLTFRRKPQHGKAALREWCSSSTIRPMLGTAWGWVQEYQERGVVHYHVLHTMEGLQRHWEAGADCWEDVRRGGAATSVLRGLAEADIAETWMAATGDRSYKSRRFNFGGLTERFRNPAAAGAYLGNYFSKMAQKTVPEGDSPEGRWWWLHPSLQPKPGLTEMVIDWPFKRAHRLVFDKRKLVGDDPRYDLPRDGDIHSAIVV